MANFVLDPCVEEELWAIWVYIARDNADAATRVIESAYIAFSELAANPNLGRPRTFNNPRLHNVRSWHIKGFQNYLIFYRQVRDCVQILHVYHGARDLEALLEDN